MGLTTHNCCKPSTVPVDTLSPEEDGATTVVGLSKQGVSPPSLEDAQGTHRRCHGSKLLRFFGDAKHLSYFSAFWQVARLENLTLLQVLRQEITSRNAFSRALVKMSITVILF